MSGIWVASMIALWVVVLGLAFFLAGALREIGLMRLRMGDDPGALITDEGLPRGAVIPDFEAIKADTGDRVTVGAKANSTRVLILLSTGCLACRQLAPHINEVAQVHTDIRLIPLVSGDLAGGRQFLRASKLRLDEALIDVGATVPGLLGTTLSPFVYVINKQGRVLARGVANDWRGLESLINEEGTLQAGRPFLPDTKDAVAAEGTHDSRSVRT